MSPILGPTYHVLTALGEVQDAIKRSELGETPKADALVEISLTVERLKSIIPTREQQYQQALLGLILAAHKEGILLTATPECKLIDRGLMSPEESTGERHISIVRLITVEARPNDKGYRILG